MIWLVILGHTPVLQLTTRASNPLSKAKKWRRKKVMELDLNSISSSTHHRCIDLKLSKQVVYRYSYDIRFFCCGGLKESGLPRLISEYLVPSWYNWKGLGSMALLEVNYWEWALRFQKAHASVLSTSCLWFKKWALSCSCYLAFILPSGILTLWCGDRAFHD